MKIKSLNIIVFLVSIMFHGKLMAQTTSGVLDQSYNDLLKLKDNLKYFKKQNKERFAKLTPILVAPPKNLWEETDGFFAQKAMQILVEVVDNPDKLIGCPDCSGFRVYSSASQKVAIDSGKLGSMNVETLTDDMRYSKASSVLYIEETKAGVVGEIVDIRTGTILYHHLANSRATLKDESSWGNYAQEYDRKKRGHSLNYVFMNLGLQPNFSLQFEFLEQWGTRNQHISGLIFSLVSPEAAFGVTYHYMLPAYRKLNFGLAAMYPLSSVATEDEETASTGGFVLQGNVAFVLGDSFGLYSALATKGGFTIGFTFFNPLLLPFIF